MKIAVYGATGYQAGLVLAELVRRGAPVVLVGRDGERLARTAARLAAVPAAAGPAARPGGPSDAPGPSEDGGIEVRVADAADHAALTAAFDGCAAVINCAGPFTVSGGTVADAAVSAGCHYVDTSGEQLHIKRVFDTLGARAERAGVGVVPAATDGCVPVDLLARLLAERLAEPVEEIFSVHRITGGGTPSRGSLRSALASLEVIGSGGLAYRDGDWRSGAPARRTSVRLPGDAAPAPVARFPLPEVVTIPRHVNVRCVEGLAEATLTARLSTPLPPETIDALPAGPAEEDRRAQRFTYVVEAAGVTGRTLRGVIRGRDTYGTTAVIAVEAARRLVADPPGPGVLVPAQAFDPADFLASLVPHGVDWTIGPADG